MDYKKIQKLKRESNKKLVEYEKEISNQIADQCDLEYIPVSKFEKEDEMHAANKSYIGGSDVGSIMGVGYKTPLEIFNRLTGRPYQEVEENEYIRSGRKMESTIAKFYEEENEDIYLINPRGTFRKGNYNATPDRFILTKETNEIVGILEIKNINEYKRGIYEIGFEDKHRYQVMHYMRLFPDLYGELCAMIGGRLPLKTERIDPEITEEKKVLYDQVDMFWKNNVMKDKAPKPMGSDTVEEQEWDDLSMIPVELTKKDSTLKELYETKLKKDNIDERYEQLKNEVRQLMGRNQIAKIGDEKIITYYPKMKFNSKVCKEKYPDISKTVVTIDKTKLRKEYTEIYNECKTREGRKLAIKWNKLYEIMEGENNE